MDQPQQTTADSIVENTNYDNVGALIRALHETGTTSIEQLRLPLEDSPFRRNGLLASSRLSPQYHRSSLPSVTVTCSDGDGSKKPTSGDHLSSQNNNHNNFNNIISPTARRFSHFNFDFGLRRFSNSNSVRTLSYSYSFLAYRPPYVIYSEKMFFAVALQMHLKYTQAC